jgi:hypothetical protein
MPSQTVTGFAMMSSTMPTIRATMPPSRTGMPAAPSVRRSWYVVSVIILDSLRGVAPLLA